MADNAINGAVQAATRSGPFEYAARTGYSFSGIMHLVIAYIIVRLAFGSAGHADQSGALATLSAQPGGAVALWLAAAGLVAAAESLGEASFGKALLIAAATGFAAYGAYCVVLARFSRM